MKKISWDPLLITELSGAYLFLDTSSLIGLLNYYSLFNPLLKELQTFKCEFLTIPSAAFEFSRSDSIGGYNTRVTFLKSVISSIFPIEQHLEEFQDLTVVLQKINGKMSYTDFLLYCCLYRFNAFLLTENHKDFLTSVLDRTQVITIDADKETIRNLAVYRFSEEKYEAAAKNILQ